jgi:DNA-binding LytR/AlgR family response regulator
MPSRDPRLRVLIVDDEPLARARLARLCTRIGDLEVCGEAGDGEAALRLMNETTPDVVLLDVEMPGLDGLAVAELRPAEGPAIVFTTAHARFALDAFDSDATDYLLKPVQPERLVRALDKVRRHRELVSWMPSPQEPPRLTVQEGATLRVFDVGAIKRFRATEKYVVFRCEGKEHETRESLHALEERLSAHGFVRVHRAELVRLSAVRALEPEPGGGATLLLDDGERVPVSRRSAADVRRLLAGHG